MSIKKVGEKCLRKTENRCFLYLKSIQKIRSVRVFVVLSSIVVFFLFTIISANAKETRIIPVLPQHSLAKKILQPDSLIMQRKKAWEIEAGMLACKGDYAGAYEKSCLIAALSDSLASRDIHLSSIAIDKAFRNWEKQQEIIRQKQELKYWNVLTYLLLFPLCAFIFMIVKQWYNYRTIQQVNLNLIEHVNMQREERDRLFRSRAELLKLQEQGGRAQQAANELLFIKINEYLEKNDRFLERDISREMLATTLGTNRNYIGDAVKSETGMTFNDYINNLRLDYAWQLLGREPSFPVNMVADESGFNSVRTFYRLFREKYGMTPSECRYILSKRKNTDCK